MAGDQPAAQPPGPARPDLHAPVQAAGQARSDTLDNAAAAKFAAGNHDGTAGDDYIRITVFLAAVLFLVGIGSTLKLPGIRYALIAFGSAVLILAVVLILQQPGLSR